MINDFYVQLGTIISGLINYPFLVSEIENISNLPKERPRDPRSRLETGSFLDPNCGNPSQVSTGFGGNKELNL